MEIVGTSTLMSGRSTTILPLAPIKARISRRQVVVSRCRRGRRSHRAQLTTLLLAITVSTQFPTSLVISCFRPIGDALIPLQAIRRRPLPLQPGRFCAALPPPSTPTAPASTNNHPRCPTRTDSFWGCAQVVDGLFMRLLSRPLGVVRIRWGICRRGWCGCGGGCRSLRSRWRPRCRPGRGW